MVRRYVKKSASAIRKKGRKTRYTRYVKRRKYISKGVSNNIHHFKERVCLGIHGPGAYNTDYHYALQFNLQQLANVLNYGGMYDQYRINKVVVSFRPICDSNELVATYQFPGKLLVVRDTDDTSYLTNQEDYYQYPDCTMLPLVSNRRLVKSLVPATLTEVYLTDTTRSFSPKFKQWIDMANANVPHYGIKFGMIRNGTTATPSNWSSSALPRVEVFVTYYFSCKNLR